VILTDLEKTFVAVSGNITTVLGSDIHIPCKPPVGIPPVDKLSWLYYEEMVEEDNSTILRHRNLIIRQAKVSDSGLYRCVADNGHFVRVSDQFYVRITLCKSYYYVMESCSMCCVM